MCHGRSNSTKCVRATAVAILATKGRTCAHATVKICFHHPLLCQLSRFTSLIPRPLYICISSSCVHKYHIQIAKGITQHAKRRLGYTGTLRACKHYYISDKNYSTRHFLHGQPKSGRVNALPAPHLHQPCVCIYCWRITLLTNCKHPYCTSFDTPTSLWISVAICV